MSEVISDAALIEQFSQKAMEEPAVEIKTEAPSEPVVTLPGGFIEANGEVIKTVEVRELNGADEEAIARAGTTSTALNVLLQRGLSKIGGRDATRDDLDLLLSGDRDAILLGIRKVTFGNDINLEGVTCTNCRENQTVVVNLVDDVPVRTLEDPVNDRMWEVETKKGSVVVALPTGITQKKLIDNVDKTTAEINTLLLSGCVMSINGRPSAGATSVLSLGAADRSKIVKEIIDRNPGPRLGEVSKACQACGEDISLPLSLLDLFRV